MRETSGRFSTRSWNESKEDPYSTVMFYDLQDYLVDVSTDRGKECLRLAFLAFLGVQIPGIDNYIDSLSPSTSYDLSSERVVDPRLWSLSTNAGWPSNPLSLFPPLDASKAITWESIAGVTVGMAPSGSVWVWPPSSLGIRYAKVVGWHRKDLRGTCMEWRILWTYCGRHQIVI